MRQGKTTMIKLYLGAAIYIVSDWIRQHGWMIACIAGMLIMILTAVTDMAIFKDGSLAVCVAVCGVLAGYAGYMWDKQ